MSVTESDLNPSAPNREKFIISTKNAVPMSQYISLRFNSVFSFSVFALVALHYAQRVFVWFVASLSNKVNE